MIDIKDFPNYSIDREGNIYSKKLDRYKAIQSDKDGYRVVTLTYNKLRKTLKIHRLLAIHFLPNTEGKLFVNHRNGIKDDNRLDNLEWCTAQENVQHSYDNGLQEGIRGELNTNSKLTENDILFIRHWHKKFRLIDIAEAFNVSKSLICKVVYRKCWKHIN